MRLRSLRISVLIIWLSLAGCGLVRPCEMTNAGCESKPDRPDCPKFWPGSARSSCNDGNRSR